RFLCNVVGGVRVAGQPIQVSEERRVETPEYLFEIHLAPLGEAMLRMERADPARCDICQRRPNDVPPICPRQPAAAMYWRVRHVGMRLARGAAGGGELIVYRDARREVDARRELAELGHLAAAGDALNFLVRLGELEQAALDAVHSSEDGWTPLDAALRRALLGAAGEFLASERRPPRPASLEAALAAVQRE